jgi:hypothetical protein
MILAIEREWHKEPGWLRSLPVEDQATVIADYRRRAREQKRAADRRNASKQGRGR